MKGEYKRFIKAIYHHKETQSNVLFNILIENQTTEFGNKHNFSGINSFYDFRNKVKINNYNDFIPYLEKIKDGGQNILTSLPVTILEPTGGSTSGTKLIPYNRGLKKDFIRGIYPWLFDFFKSRKSILKGRSYWSITPSTIKPYRTKGGIPVGFKDDTDYFGIAGKFLKCGLIEPEGLESIENHDQFYYRTLLHLLRVKKLSFISAWHPSLLIILIDKMQEFKNELIEDVRIGQSRLEPGRKFKPMKKRSDFLKSNLNPKTIWPGLTTISCWTDGSAKMFVNRLKEKFPEIEIQGKGLLATEGIVSFPFQKLDGKILSIRSHFFEFIDYQTQDVKYSWELEKGKFYTVIITTSGGFYRYNLHDIVEVTGFYNGVPLLRFCGKEDLISDYRGEKLNEFFVRDCVDLIIKPLNLNPDLLRFRPVEKKTFQYELEIYLGKTIKLTELTDLEKKLEQLLCKNIHYKYARDIGQIDPVRIKILKSDKKILEKYIKELSQNRNKLGIIKPFIIN